MVTTSLETVAQQVRTLEASFTRTEAIIERTFAELKAMIKDEVLRLKNDQLAEIRKEAERLADDQRRSWEAIRALERNENERKGGFKIIHALWAAVLAALGAIATLLVAYKH